jgi:MarR family transcriptional regulator for hemolysin
MANKKNHRLSVGFLISDVARLLRRNFDQRVQDLGLTQAQWRAIAQLSREEGIKQVVLAERLEVKPITLARLVDRLEAAGWVKRRADREDRRATRLYLTAKSQPILSVMASRVSETLAEALGDVTAAGREQLVEALLQMKTNLLAAEAAVQGNSAGQGTKNGRTSKKSSRAN